MLLFTAIPSFAQYPDPTLTFVISSKMTSDVPMLMLENTHLSSIEDANKQINNYLDSLTKRAKTNEDYWTGSTGGSTVMEEGELIVNIFKQLKKIPSDITDLYTACDLNKQRKRVGSITMAGEYADELKTRAESYALSHLTDIYTGISNVVRSYNTANMTTTNERYKSLLKLYNDVTAVRRRLQGTIVTLGGIN